MDYKKLTEDYFAAFNKHDADATRSLFATEGNLRDWDISKTGDEIATAVGGIFKAVPDIKCNILHMHISADTKTVVAELKIDLKADASESILVADVLTFDAAGKIASLRAYKG